ncbi:MAG: DUF5106 domain-containing protein, partial [Bacteroides sp.]|nr:DUF5106 domain-containing protein [Bacteroides sp.]
MTTAKYISFAIAICLCSCKSGNASQQENSVQQDTIRQFTLPSIPTMMTEPEQRAEFLVKHYWDNINFADTNYIHHPEVTEQGWADYCDILNHVPLQTAQAAIKQTMTRTEANKKVYTYMTELADKYLYDPNSPMRNEEFYIPVLEAMVASPVLDETEKIRPQARLELAQRNRKGSKALDFTYTEASGKQGSLYGIKAVYTLLFINNPGCHACAETIEALKNSSIINKLMADKKLTVLALYPDEELDEWKKHLKDFPTEWISGYDKKLTLKTENRYDLRAIPTLYLLDKNKMVLLKDAPTKAVEEYLTLHHSLEQ